MDDKTIITGMRFIWKHRAVFWPAFAVAGGIGLVPIMYAFLNYGPGEPSFWAVCALMSFSALVGTVLAAAAIGNRIGER